MIPAYIKPFLWSYNINKIDIKKHKKRIILNILNIGTRQARLWLFSTYDKKEIKQILIKYGHELSPKSLNYWLIIFNIKKDIVH